MGKWRIRIPLDGLQSILRNTGDELIEREVKFNYRGTEHVGNVIIDSENEDDAINQAMHLVDKELGRIYFAYNIEPSVKRNASYVIDLSKDRRREYIRKDFGLRYNYWKEDNKLTLSNITSFDHDKTEVMDLALSYYKLSEYNNPLRIESLFSCMTTIVRSLTGKDRVSTSDLRQKIKQILRKTDTSFSETEFDNNWIDFYVDERCSIAHGSGSKLIDIRTHEEYQRIASKVGHWTTLVLYYYIEQHKKSKG